MSDKTPRTLHLEQVLYDAVADVIDLYDVICIRMHPYNTQLESMVREMTDIGFRLVSATQIQHRLCSNGREFWWARAN